MLHDHLYLGNCRMRPDCSMAWHAQMVSIQTHGRADLTDQQACPPSGCHARSTDLLYPRTSFPVRFSSRRRRSKCVPSVSRSWASKSAANDAASIYKTPSIVSVYGQAAGTTLLSSSSGIRDLIWPGWLRSLRNVRTEGGVRI